MRIVLIKADADWTPWLRRTALWRCDIERVWVGSNDEAFSKAASLQPRLLILQTEDGDDALALIRRLRLDGATARLPVIVLSREKTDDAREFDLLRAGASAVFSMGAGPDALNPALERLLGVAPRRAPRAAVRFEVWGRNVREEDLQLGWCLNLSARGLLLETEAPLAVGTHLAFRFDLPGGRGVIRGVCQVVRAALREEGYLSGVEFLVIQGDGRERLAAFIESLGSDSNSPKSAEGARDLR
jgi:CheY-like chemotaxis protein